MSNWRDTKLQARRVVHDTFYYEARYIAEDNATSIPVNVRVHRNDETYGNYDGIGFAETTTSEFTIVFMDSPQVIDSLARGGIIRLNHSGEKYYIEYVGEPGDEIRCGASKKS